jgi:hypothetical protein
VQDTRQICSDIWLGLALRRKQAGDVAGYKRAVRASNTCLAAREQECRTPGRGW